MSASDDEIRGWISARRDAVRARLGGLDASLADIRVARADWTDEEHDPEGFALVDAWSRAEGSRAERHRELAELDASEARLDAGAYGVCVRCGEPIPEAQLERRPERVECVACTDRRR